MADCAFAANADYLISHDRHFDKLREYGFPQITVLTIQALAAVPSKQPASNFLRKELINNAVSAPENKSNVLLCGG